MLGWPALMRRKAPGAIASMVVNAMATATAQPHLLQPAHEWLFPNATVVVYPDHPLSLRELNLLKGIGFNSESLSQWMSEVP